MAASFDARDIVANAPVFDASWKRKYLEYLPATRAESHPAAQVRPEDAVRVDVDSVPRSVGLLAHPAPVSVKSGVE